MIAHMRICSTACVFLFLATTNDERAKTIVELGNRKINSGQ
jgi:hypothetical protein